MVVDSRSNVSTASGLKTNRRKCGRPFIHSLLCNVTVAWHSKVYNSVSQLVEGDPKEDHGPNMDGSQTAGEKE